MANSMYGLGRESFLEAQIEALTDTLALAMFTTAYTPNLTTDQFYSTPIASSGLVGAKVSLTSVTGLLGTLSAANLTFTSVSGSTASYLVLFKDTGTNSTSRLIGLIDTATGLPVTPNGGNITVAWASGQVFTLFQGLEIPAPKIIMHDPTPSQKWAHQEWLDERRHARELERAYARRFGRPVPVL